MPTLTNNGKADWIDYTDYWREADAEWLQARSILRYVDGATRSTDWPTPVFGHVTYNESVDRLEVFSKVANAWAQVPQWTYLKSTQDTSTGVALSHSAAGGKGIVFQPTQTVLDNPILVMGGVLKVDSTGVFVKTGTKTVKLSTDTANLVSDSPISAPSLVSAGAITAASASLSGTLTVTGTLTGSGTISGLVVNGGTGTIGGIGLASNIVAIPAGSAAANGAGVQSGQGLFYGDTTSAVMRQRPTAASAAGAAYVQATATVVNLQGTTVEFMGQPKVLSNRSLQYVTNAGTYNGGPVIVNPTDPGVANVPEGTMWIQA